MKSTFFSSQVPGRKLSIHHRHCHHEPVVSIYRSPPLCCDDYLERMYIRPYSTTVAGCCCTSDACFMLVFSPFPSLVLWASLLGLLSHILPLFFLQWTLMILLVRLALVADFLIFPSACLLHGTTRYDEKTISEKCGAFFDSLMLQLLVLYELEISITFSRQIFLHFLPLPPTADCLLLQPEETAAWSCSFERAKYCHVQRLN